MSMTAITDREFERFRDLIYRIAGISLTAGKKALVCGRLAKRLRQYQLRSYGEYFDLLTTKQNHAELQIAVDLLTTNETSFFREPKHFDFLRDEILATHPPGRLFRVWSAACSSGEEPYSVAMILADCLGATPWEVLGSDLSTRVLDRARAGLYALERAKTIPRRYLLEHCLKGVEDQAGTLLIDPRLRTRVRFFQHNLTSTMPPSAAYDVILLRNVLIYFDVPTKRRVVARTLRALKPGGYFLVGHSESLHGIVDLKPVRPSIYRNL